MTVTKARAAGTSATLCILFFIVYGSCNYLTSLRHDVGAWVYAWERHIPFVPLFIIPYMSIDLFFAAAPFLCRDRDELRTLSRRIALAILVAGLFFLAMPLRFTFERPHVDGWLGLIFNQFREMDRPFNQFPSLHICLRTILADVYARHTRGITRWMSHVWFSLIGASTLLVYQHHVADVVGGFLLAGVCFYAIGGAKWKLPVTPNRKVGVIYLCGAAALAAVAMPLAVNQSRWWLLLLWPATSLAILSSAYFGFGPGPGVFRKRDGKLPLSAKLMMWPIILGQRVSLLRYRMRSKAWDQITDRLWLGRVLSDREAEDAIAKGVSAVLDVTVELPENRPFRALPHYRHLPVLDLTAPTPEQKAEAMSFLDEQLAAGRTVYVHCKAGYSRSGAIVGSYLIHAGIVADAGAAAEMLCRRRVGIILRREARAAIGVDGKLSPAASSPAPPTAPSPRSGETSAG